MKKPNKTKQIRLKKGGGGGGGSNQLHYNLLPVNKTLPTIYWSIEVQ